MPDEKPPPQPEADSLDPLGFEFFAGQGVVLLGVVVGVLLAARFGFSGAIALTDREDARRALTALQLVDAELVANVADLKLARDKLACGDSPRAELHTSTLEAAAGKPYMVQVDPALLADVEKLFTYPIPELVQSLHAPNGLLPEQRDAAQAQFTKVVDRAESSVLPRLRAEEARLAAKVGSR